MQVEAVGRIESIATVSGVDGIFFGPADLAAELGHVDDLGYPEIHDVVVEAIQRIVAAGQPAGFLSTDRSFLHAVSKAGASFVAHDTDVAALKRGLAGRLKQPE